MDLNAIVQAQQAFDNAVSDNIRDIDDTLIYAEMLFINDLQKVSIEDKKGNSYIYTFTTETSEEAERLHSACKTVKDREPKPTFKMPRVHKQNPESRCLYVGSSITGIEKRINQHLGFSYDTTYSLQLNKWASAMRIAVTVKVFEIPTRDQQIVQIIEDYLWSQLFPVLGKKGGK